MSMAGFAFFFHYFVCVNTLQGKINVEHTTDEIIVDDLNLLGIDNLWRILLETENPEVCHHTFL